MNQLRSLLLLIHVFSASVWIVICLGLAFVAAGLRPEAEEFKSFGAKVVPKLNVVDAIAAGALLATGVANFVLLGILVNFDFSLSFVGLVAAKLALFILMAVGLFGSWRVQAGLRAPVSRQAGAAMRRLGALSGLVALLGAAALSLGLWLMGTPVN